MSLKLMFQPLRKYADFEGRACPKEYWLFTLFTHGVLILLLLLAFSFLAAGLLGYALMLWALMFIGLLIPGYAVSVRRLHDTNRTGFWIALPIGVLTVFGLVFSLVNSGPLSELAAQLKTSDDTPSLLFVEVITKFYIVVWLPFEAAKCLLLIFHLLSGTPGPNRFGPDPKSVDTPSATVISEADADS